MKKFAKTIGYVLSLMAVMATLGGHWIALQTVAWTCMIVDLSKTETLTSAITKTFDASHPCKLCLAIRDGRQQEQREDKKPLWSNFEDGLTFILESRSPSLPPPSSIAHLSVPVTQFLHTDWIQAPPSPPPRAIAA